MKTFTHSPSIEEVRKGSFVKVVRGIHIGDPEHWGDCWVEEMDATVGETYQVVRCNNDNTIRLETKPVRYNYPRFCLELIHK
jgi:hypothetical protein